MVQGIYLFSWYFGKSIEVSLPLFSMVGKAAGSVFGTALQSPLSRVKLECRAANSTTGLDGGEERK